MSCVVAKGPNFIFTHIPTTGGTSLFSRKFGRTREVLKSCDEYRYAGGHKYLRNLVPPNQLKDYFKFAIVRNPFDRFVSHWRIRMPGVAFDKFTDLVNDRKVPWLPLRAQSRWISTIPRGCGATKLLTDKVLRYENYEEEVNATLSDLGLPQVKLPHLRKISRKKDYRFYYKRFKTVDIVAELYKEDLENFNYSFEGGANEAVYHHK